MTDLRSPDTRFRTSLLEENDGPGANPSDNRTLMRNLRESVGMAAGVPAWRWMLEPAMWVLRTEPELVLKSRWVVPHILTAAGFTFQHPDLRDAIEHVAAR